MDLPDNVTVTTGFPNVDVVIDPTLPHLIDSNAMKCSPGAFRKLKISSFVTSRDVVVMNEKVAC